jgi:hypothetical protein
MRLAPKIGLILLATGWPLDVHASDSEAISVRNQRAVSLAFLRMPPRRSLLATGQREWDVALTVANDFRSLPGLEEDYEITRLAITRRFGLPGRSEWWLEGVLCARTGGMLDGLIDWWHANVLHWSDPLRVAASRGRARVHAAGQYDFGTAVGLGDLTVGWSHSLGSRATVTFAVKLPTGDPSTLLGSGAIDCGASLTYSVPIHRRLSLQAQLGGVVQGRAKRLPNTRTLVDQQCVALVWHPNSRDAWIAQWQSEGAPLSTGIPGADGPHRILVFGFRRNLDERSSIELHFTEDRDVVNGRVPAVAHIGPDFGFGIRYRIRS